MGNPPWACLRKKDLGWDRGVESKKVVQHVYLVGAKSIYRVAEKDKEYLRDEEEKNQNENEQIGNMDVPFYIPHDDERARFGLPSSARVFHAIKKHDFKEENEIRSIIYKNSQEAGLQIPFNFKGFVSRVVLNPKSNDQQKEAIIELLNRYSYTTIVEE